MCCHNTKLNCVQVEHKHSFFFFSFVEPMKNDKVHEPHPPLLHHPLNYLFHNVAVMTREGSS